MGGADLAVDPTGSELRRAAMDLLARREHSRKELRDKLSRRFGQAGISGDASNANDACNTSGACNNGMADNRLDIELERLAQEGLQSDQRFAESFVHSRLQRRQGPLRVRQEMRLRGLDPALIDDALQAVEPRQWHMAALEAVAARFGSEPPADRKDWSRRARFLQGRGFHAGQINTALAGPDADEF